MYAGQIVEEATVFDLFDRPRHPYTEALLVATPDLLQRDRRTIRMPELLGGAVNARGCRFAARCSYVVEACRRAPVELANLDGRLARCIRADELHLTSSAAGSSGSAAAAVEDVNR
jgi:oligopeptide/dipeptide ABC transporter ATP-binding protein